MHGLVGCLCVAWWDTYAWPGGVREGRAAFATVSALPSQRATLRWSPSGFHTGANLAGLWAVPNKYGPPQGFC